MDMELYRKLNEKAAFVWRETLRLHALAPETRIASSLSPVEIFTVLYYGGILEYNPHNPVDEKRDRFIVSKGHGSVSMYPILADKGFFPASELDRICESGSILGGIPDPVIPGYETVNGSLGHGLGVACGIACALKRKSSNANVIVLAGDGELYEGANWEAAMFAPHHKLENLLLIVDDNRISMLDYCENILDHSPLAEKFRAFGWTAVETDGHNIKELYDSLTKLKATRRGVPKALIARTVKGRGVRELESDRLCHIRTLSPERVLELAGSGA